MSELLERQLATAKRRIEILETMIEDKTRDLFLATEDLRRAHLRVTRIVDRSPTPMVVVDANRRVEHANPAALKLLECSSAELVGSEAALFCDDPCTELAGECHQVECNWTTKQGASVPVLLSTAPLHCDKDQFEGAVWIGVDLRQRRKREIELRHSQKLEAVGQLAAGIAHEINNPVQFVNDSVEFLEEVFADISRLIQAYQSFATDGEKAGPQIQHAQSIEEEIDIEFLMQETPQAICRALDGLSRVASIVAAMKELSHPGQIDAAPADLNHAIQNALTVSANQYKYVADVALNLGEIPSVPCHISDVNQVLLNLIVNAAQAMEEDLDEGARGTLSISTHVEQDQVVVEISDTGPGIPDAVQEKIFDPFFTTKAVGQGTGQGLAISRSIVDRHGGRLEFRTTQGQGTTFIVRLPLEGAATGEPVANP